jgi:hypothetical protein
VTFFFLCQLSYKIKLLTLITRHPAFGGLTRDPFWGEGQPNKILFASQTF